MPTISIAPRDVARELARRYSTMTHDELDLLESILVAKRYAKNEKILTEGEVCENIYWIVKGLVRQFYYKNGKKYAHTIDPKSGYPVQHSLLSSTVLAKTCAEADAYATSFMVMGIDKAEKIIDRHNDLMGYLIYDDNGKNKVWYSKNLKKNVEE